MRISVDPQDRGHMVAGILAKVFLNDLPLTLCITADEEAGTVECYKADADGHLALDANHKPQFETLHGKVRIDLSDCALPDIRFGSAVRERIKADRARAAA